MRAFILTPTYRVVEGTPQVHLHGVHESGDPCLIVDDRVRPYFFVRTADRPRVESLLCGARIEETSLRTLDGESVARVEAAVPGDVPSMRRRLEDQRIACFEADIRFAYRYMIDHGIRGSVYVQGAYEKHRVLGRLYHNPRLTPCRWQPKLKTLSIDIETSLDGKRLLSLALHSPQLSRVLFVGREAFEHGEPVRSERALIRRFLEYLRELDPDVITGWNVVDFDLAVLHRFARRFGIRFAIGRTDDEFDRRRDALYVRESRAIVFGRLVLDALSLLRGAFVRLRDYKLETAAQAILGYGKLLDGDHRGHEIERLYEQDPRRLIEYNLQDARLVSEILERTGLIDLAVERSLLTGMPLDRVSAAIASVDSLYLAELRQQGYVAPSVPLEAEEAPLTGGYVMESQPGLYRNVLVFDFKSLYPSIIRTFNLDPLTLVRNGPAENTIEAPNGARFRRDVKGILPRLVATLAEERARATDAGQKTKSQAIKILMNSLYGVLGSSASRLFFPPVANAITHFGQLLIRTAAAYAEQKGYRVIYGDTDSLFVYPAMDDARRALALGETLRAEIGNAVASFITARFGCESHLELEFEKLYHRFFLPEVRGGAVGSKKRYAGLLVGPDGTEQIEFVGLESVRRDWSDVSKRFQRGLLDLVFHDRPVDDFVRRFVRELREGRFDAELVYRKAIRKDLNAYTKTTPPHVRAARMLENPGRMVEYVMTRNGPEPAGKLSAPIDYDHYVEHQLRPVAEAILRFLGTDFDRVAETRRQLELF